MRIYRHIPLEKYSYKGNKIDSNVIDKSISTKSLYATKIFKYTINRVEVIPLSRNDMRGYTFISRHSANKMIIGELFKDDIISKFNPNRHWVLLCNGKYRKYRKLPKEIKRQVYK